MDFSDCVSVTIDTAGYHSDWPDALNVFVKSVRFLFEIDIIVK